MFVIDTKFATGRMALVFSFVSTFPRQCQTNGFSRNLLFSGDDKERDFPRNCCRHKRHKETESNLIGMFPTITKYDPS